MSIAPICNACGNELDVPGALVFSPPTLDDITTKWHLCVSCFDDHFAVFTEDSWTVEHSFECRLSGAMVECAWHKAIERVAGNGPLDPLGRFRIVEIDSEGLPSLVRAS